MNAASEVHIDVVKFNVGGQKFDCARSLLSLYPDTMIAKSASDQWQIDSKSEIFLERDGTLFQFVLCYLRDGKVMLPLTTAKRALLDELSYYGVEVVDEHTIDDGKMQGVTATNAFHESICYMTKIANEARKAHVKAQMMANAIAKDGECAFIAAGLIENHMTNAVKYKYGNETKQYEVKYSKHSAAEVDETELRPEIFL
jgi:hypothetical protein